MKHETWNIVKKFQQTTDHVVQDKPFQILIRQQSEKRNSIKKIHFHSVFLTDVLGHVVQDDLFKKIIKEQS